MIWMDLFLAAIQTYVRMDSGKPQKIFDRTGYIVKYFIIALHIIHYSSWCKNIIFKWLILPCWMLVFSYNQARFSYQQGKKSAISEAALMTWLRCSSRRYTMTEYTRNTHTAVGRKQIQRDLPKGYDLASETLSYIGAMPDSNLVQVTCHGFIQLLLKSRNRKMKSCRRSLPPKLINRNNS
jgi:hypothetical protein